MNEAPRITHDPLAPDDDAPDTPAPKEWLGDIRSRGCVSLSDLDAWCKRPRRYEAERAALVRCVVKHGLALFTGESLGATTPRGEATEGGVPEPSAIYLREVRRIAPMERSEEFRYVIALEIAKEVLDAEARTPRPTEAEHTAMRRDIATQDPSWLRMLAAIKPSSDPAPAADVIEARVARVRARLHEMIEWKRVLVVRTLPLVPGIARRYRGMGVPFMDLVQEANTSLMKATDRYEWRKGVRFVVYARFWVQQGILKSLSCQSRTVRTPVYLAQKQKKIRDLNELAYSGSGQRLSPEQIGKALDEPVERVERALAAVKLTVSLDQDLDPRGDFVLREVLADPHEMELSDTPAGPPLAARIGEALTALTDRERMVVELRYGLSRQPAETLEEVSQRLGISRERVRQIQEQALRKLLGPSKRLHLSAFLPEPA
jgi:RNA polymerase sigma factor (sigma-70 family)